MPIQNYFTYVPMVAGKKNFVPRLQHEGRLLTAQPDKAEALHDHFTAILGTAPETERAQTINWELLNMQPDNLQHLDEPLTEQEVHRAIMEAPVEKAPGPDGYIGLFYRCCWNIVKSDLMKALEDIFNLREDAIGTYSKHSKHCLLAAQKLGSSICQGL